MVSSLKVLAANGQNFDGIICPLMDARRGTAFMAAYQGETLDSVIADQHSEVKDFILRLKELGRPVLFVGIDVEIHKEVIHEILGEQASFAAPQNRLPRASNLIMLAKQSEEQNVHHAVPEYRRITEAEANYNKAQGGEKS